MPRRRPLLAALIGAVLCVALPPAHQSASAAPAPPIISSPASGATVQADATLSWLPVDGATGYRVQLGADPSFGIVYKTADTKATSIELEELFDTGLVHWRVAARDASGLGPWSVGTFTAQVADGPDPTGPANGAQFEYPRDAPVLSWEATPYRPFDIEISGPAGLGQYITFANTFVMPDTHEPGIYSWRVRARANPPGVGWSSWRTFEIDWPNAVPPIVGPPQGASLEAPVLDWDPLPGIERYDLEISRDPTFPQQTTNRIHGMVETASSLGLTDQAVTVWWRVRGRFGGNTLPWSAPRSLTHTAWNDAPTNLYPVGQTLLNRTTLRWAPVAGAYRYEVQLASSQDALLDMTTACRSFVNAISYGGSATGACPGLGPSSVSSGFYWRVRGIAYSVLGDIATPWSSVAQTSFAGPNGPATLADPVVATPIGPSDCAVVTTCQRETEMPLLQWQPVPGARFYRVQLDRRDSHEPGRTWDVHATTFVPPVDIFTELGVDRWSWQVVACEASSACPDWVPASANVRHFTITPRTIELGPTPSTLQGEVRLMWGIPLPDAPSAGQPWDIVQQPKALWLDVDTVPDFDGPSLQVGGSQGATGSAYITSLPAGPIYWRVAYDTGAAFSSATDSFTYRFQASGLQPHPGSGMQTPAVVRWTPVPGAVSYDVEIEGTNGWHRASGGPWAGDLIGGNASLGPLSWRVTPVNVHMQKGRPVGSSFVVVAQNPALTSPSNGERVPIVGTGFDWAPVDAAAEYRLEVSTDQGFSDIIEQVTTLRTRYVARVEYPIGQLWWRVKAFVQGELIGTSPIRSATTSDVEPPPPPPPPPPGDTTPPTVTAPSHRLVNGSAISGGRTAVRLAWTGSDAASGVARYELAQSTDGGAWSTVSTTLTASSLDRLLAPNHTYRFRLVGIDGAGNASPPVFGPTFRLTHYGETNSRLTYSGTWSLVTGSTYWGAKAKASSRAGATASLTFTGRSIEWVSRKGPTRGKALVYINGVLKATVDLYASTYQNQRVAWTGSWSSSATRTITVKVLGTSGRPRVDLDAFVVGI